MGILYESKNRIVECSYNNKKNQLRFAPHFHYAIEIVKMVEGEADCFIESKRYRVRKGDIFIAFPNQVHYYDSFGEEAYYIFFVNPSVIPEFKELLETNVPRNACIRREDVSDRLNNLFEEVYKSTKEIESGEKYAKEMRDGYLRVLFGEILRHMDLYGPDPAEATTLKNIIDYCSKNYTKDLSLDLLAKDLHMSKYYISHTFSNKLNMKFNDYINSIRISMACMLMWDKSLSITDVSTMVGFSTIRTFNRAFLRFAGKSPSEFRKQGSDSEKQFVSSSPAMNSLLLSEKFRKADDDKQ